jgi:hypothetical protein
MKRIIIPAIMLFMSLLMLSPASAGSDPLPAVCYPDPSLQYQKYGNNQTEILYEPDLSVNCPMYLGEIVSPGVVTQVIYGVERQYKNTSEIETVVSFTRDAAYVSGQNFGGPYYSLGGGVDITGTTLGSHYRYRVYTLVQGYFYDAAAPDHMGSSFNIGFYSQWVDGPDQLQVRFNGADELVSEEREPTVLQTSTQLTNGQSR